MTATMSRIPKIATVCLAATVGICMLFALLEQTGVAYGGDGTAASTTSTSRSDLPSQSTNSIVNNPMSLLYQQLVPLRKPSKKEEMALASIPSSTELTVAPVKVLVCVEALCIDCQRFFHDQVMIAFNALGHTVMTLTVVPFGNAQLPSSSAVEPLAVDNDNNANLKSISSSSSNMNSNTTTSISNTHTKITCQHGDGECDTNAYEQCAIHLYPDPPQHVPYLGCLFAALPMGHRDAPFDQWMGLEPCAHEHHLDFGLLQQCHNDADLTWQLQQAAAKATPTRHDHVPWVEINGMPMDEGSTTLLKEVCRVYRQAGGHDAGCSSSLDDEFDDDDDIE